MVSGTAFDYHAPGYRAGRVGLVQLLCLEEEFEFLAQQLSEWGSISAWSSAHPEAVCWRGRGRLFVVPRGDGHRWVVRRLRHGGVLAGVTGDRFLALGRPRSVNELLMSLALAGMGIETPPVVAALVYFRGLCYRGEVVRRMVEGRDLSHCLFGASASRGKLRSEELRAAGHLLARLCANGVFHPDLNLRNVLIGDRDGTVRAYLLDLEKCEVRASPRDRLGARMLARLRRSAQRLGDAHGMHLSPEDWEAFLEGYHARI